MRLEDVGANPVKLAIDIHLQLGARSGAVPVKEIAYALDIHEIREEILTNAEGVLITTAERDRGSILVNLSSHRRRRFTLAHELGHFLIAWHQPTDHDRFECRRSDMVIKPSSQASRHQCQEAEANAFAIELLAPRGRLKRHLSGAPDLENVLAIADEFDISREAAVRRYVELHDVPLAAIFSHGGRVSYMDYAPRFPRLGIVRGSTLFDIPSASSASPVSDIEEADPRDWLGPAIEIDLGIQTLHQQDGYAITLLIAEDPDEE